MAPLAGKPLLEHLLERVSSLGGASRVVLATSTDPGERRSRRSRGPGSESRHSAATKTTFSAATSRSPGARRPRTWCASPATIPLTDLPLIESLCRRHLEADADYTYVPGDALLMGILSEVISRRALETSHRDGEDRHRSELVTLYIKENPERFRIERAELSAGALPTGVSAHGGRARGRGADGAHLR